MDRVLGNLPPKSVAAVRRTCRSWRTKADVLVQVRLLWLSWASSLPILLPQRQVYIPTLPSAFVKALNSSSSHGVCKLCCAASAPHLQEPALLALAAFLATRAAICPAGAAPVPAPGPIQGHPSPVPFGAAAHCQHPVSSGPAAGQPHLQLESAQPAPGVPAWRVAPPGRLHHQPAGLSQPAAAGGKPVYRTHRLDMHAGSIAACHHTAQILHRDAATALEPPQKSLQALIAQLSLLRLGPSALSRHV